MDGDVLVAQEVFEEEDEDDMDQDEDEDEDSDDFVGDLSRFPAGFMPMRMCQWYPSGNCRRGWECMFAHHENELHPDAGGYGA